MISFTQFVAIDWSGAQYPQKTGAIAVAICDVKHKNIKAISPKYAGFSGSQWSRHNIMDFIILLSQQSERTLIGIDCNFGYARSIGVRQFGPDYNFKTLWSAVEQTCCQNKDGLNNDFYAKAFWTHPHYKDDFWVQGKQNGFKLHRRETEKACHKAGFGYPESPFKLIGPKQVGKGGLAGMRVAYHLQKHRSHNISFWPFEANKIQTTKVVITEIYPRLYLRMAGHGNSKITELEILQTSLKDFNATIEHMDHLNDHQSDAIIAAAGMRFLCRDADRQNSFFCPQNLDVKTAQTEGWIFGVP